MTTAATAPQVSCRLPQAVVVSNVTQDNTNGVSASGAPVPVGWSADIVLYDTVREMLAESTGLAVDSVELVELAGPRYVFRSGEDHYIYNSISQDGARITTSHGRDAVFKELAEDFDGIRYEVLEVSNDGDLER
ncbi:uncharacterized protein FIBRA_04829 [Fibroporia radiculosa]|uniref:Uncharacterized protein n=1 Tax=Fibroporia radiculosa TaxID=599839 RepID=J4HWR5_9APHY|nr:uncharacterized protein FIBRA_04829 [Fibroporia radiculosa]CCM02722.1 predicted protein [Fibroporia radiculosa]